MNLCELVSAGAHCAAIHIMLFRQGPMPTDINESRWAKCLFCMSCWPQRVCWDHGTQSQIVLINAAVSPKQMQELVKIELVLKAKLCYQLKPKRNQNRLRGIILGSIIRPCNGRCSLRQRLHAGVIHIFFLGSTFLIFESLQRLPAQEGESAGADLGRGRVRHRW